MAGIQKILLSDTLQSGFRVKANANFDEIIESVTQIADTGNPTGVFRLNKNGGGFIDLALTDQYYTKSQVATLISNISSSPYLGAWDIVHGAYAAGLVTDHNGKLWRANTITAYEPGTDGTWDDVLSSTEPPIIEIPLGAGDPQVFSYPYTGNALAPGLVIYAEQIITLDNPFTGVPEDAVVPYSLSYAKFSNNYITLTRQDISDVVKVTIKA